MKSNTTNHTDMKKNNNPDDVGMTVEEMMKRLPHVFLESEAISDAAKKVMAALFHLFVTNEQAQRTGNIVCPNYRLRNITRIGQNQMRDAVNELKEYTLIERKPGKTWEKGKQKEASIYGINFEAIDKPIRRKTFDDYRRLWENLASNHIEEQPAPVITIDEPAPIQEPATTTDSEQLPPALNVVFNKAGNATTPDEILRLRGQMYGILQDHIDQNGITDKEKSDELYHKAENRFEQCQVTSLKAV